MASTTPTSAARPEKDAITKQPLRMGTMSDEFASTHTIKCECAGRTIPENGHSLVECNTCHAWLHMNCMLGTHHAFTAAEGTHGYQCRPCKFAIRSEPGKRAYQKKLTASSEKKFSLLGDRAKADGTTSPLSAKSKSKLPNLLATPTPPKNSTKTDLPETVPIVTAQSTDTPMKDVDDNSPGLRCDEDSESKRTINPKPAITAGSKRKSTHDDEAVEDPIEQWKKSTETPRVFCKCENSPAGKFHDYFLCVRCTRLQHKGCIPSAENDPIGRGLLCEECREARLEKVFRYHRHKVHQARRDRKQLQERFEAARKIRHARLRGVVTDRYWKDYCDLPSGQSSPAVLELTRTYFNDGKMIPIHPAPAGWVDEVIARIFHIVNPANKELVLRVMGEDELLMSVHHPDRLRRGLNELAILTIYHGPLKGKKQKLGVLAELLGLEEKGVYWKG